MPFDLVRQLRISGLLKQDWDPQKHPRWPAGSPDSVGGQFAPAGADAASAVTGQDASADQNAQVIPAQLTLPAPFEWQIPIPPRFPPVPLAPPDISPRDLPKNPYPDRPDCEQEWAEAYRRCWELAASGKLGQDGHRGMGSFLYQCILGQVSEDCGGSPIDRGSENA